MIRRWHRWAAIPAAVFLMIVSLTGVLIHLDLWRTGTTPPTIEIQNYPPLDPLPPTEDLAKIVTQIADIARDEKGVPVRFISIAMIGGEITAVAGPLPYAAGPHIKMNGRTGERIPPPPQQTSFYVKLQDIHAGYMFGLSGRILSVLCGIALLILCVTGLQVWWDLKKRGKKGMYW